MKGWLKAILFFIAWILTQVIITSPLIIALGTDGESLNKISAPDRTTIQILTAILQLIGTGFIVYIFLKYIDKTPFKNLGLSLQGKGKHLGLGLLLGIGLISVGMLALTMAGMITLSYSNPNTLALATSSILFAIVAVNEEIMARGYLLRVLMESCNKYWALIISAVVFAILHGLNPNVSWVALLNLFLAGCLLGVYYIHYNNLWFSIGLHFTWNYFQGPIWGSNVCGTTTESLFTQQLSGNDLITGGAFGFEASLMCSALIIISIIMVEVWAKKANPLAQQAE